MPRPRGRSNRPHPPVSLAVAQQVAQAIADKNASRPMNRLLLAEAMGYSPSSSGFRDRVTSSAKYGLTEGSYNSEVISVTALGDTVTRPRNDGEQIEARRGAIRNVPLFDTLVDHFGNSKLPDPKFLKNTLERDPFGIDPAWSESAAEAFTEDARAVGYLRDIGGSPHIVLDASTSLPPSEVQPPGAEIEQPEAADEGSADNAPADATQSASAADSRELHEEVPQRPLPMQLFVAHGKNRRPLEQLKGILNSWKVPFLVAVDEPNAGRPISEKVAETMRECSAGIFIFTADEHFLDPEGNEVMRPSQNVVYELGAASLLYGRKIVILKESGVTFPSDFSDLGWIEFERDALDAKAMDLLREMIALEAVRLVSAGSG